MSDETEEERLSNHINYMMELIEEMEIAGQQKLGQKSSAGDLMAKLGTSHGIH